jgi:hypothetical protein
MPTPLGRAPGGEPRHRALNPHLRILRPNTECPHSAKHLPQRQGRPRHSLGHTVVVHPLDQPDFAISELDSSNDTMSERATAGVEVAGRLNLGRHIVSRPSARAQERQLGRAVCHLFLGTTSHGQYVYSSASVLFPQAWIEGSTVPKHRPMSMTSDQHRSRRVRSRPAVHRDIMLLAKAVIGCQAGRRHPVPPLKGSPRVPDCYTR